MSSRRLACVTLLAALLGGSGIGFAQGTTTATPQTHHCKLPDGTMDMKKTHKQCTAAKGSWAKDAPKAGAAPAPSPKPAPSAPAPNK
jgi:hypothetical protein